MAANSVDTSIVTRLSRRLLAPPGVLHGVVGRWARRAALRRSLPEDLGQRMGARTALASDALAGRVVMRFPDVVARYVPQEQAAQGAPASYAPVEMPYATFADSDSSHSHVSSSEDSAESTPKVPLGSSSSYASASEFLAQVRAMQSGAATDAHPPSQPAAKSQSPLPTPTPTPSLQRQPAPAAAARAPATTDGASVNRAQTARPTAPPQKATPSRRVRIFTAVEEVQRSPNVAGSPSVPARSDREATPSAPPIQPSMPASLPAMPASTPPAPPSLAATESPSAAGDPASPAGTPSTRTSSQTARPSDTSIGAPASTPTPPAPAGLDAGASRIQRTPAQKSPPASALEAHPPVASSLQASTPAPQLTLGASVAGSPGRDEPLAAVSTTATAAVLPAIAINIGRAGRAAGRAGNRIARAAQPAPTAQVVYRPPGAPPVQRRPVTTNASTALAGPTRREDAPRSDTHIASTEPGMNASERGWPGDDSPEFNAASFSRTLEPMVRRAILPDDFRRGVAMPQMDMPLAQAAGALRVGADEAMTTAGALGDSASRAAQSLTGAAENAAGNVRATASRGLSSAGALAQSGMNQVTSGVAAAGGQVREAATNATSAASSTLDGAMAGANSALSSAASQLGNALSPLSANAAGAPKLDVERLARQLAPHLKRILAVERERMRPF